MRWLPLLLALSVALPAVAQSDPAAAKAEYKKLTQQIEDASKAYRSKMEEITSTDEYKKLRAEYQESRDREVLAKLRAMTSKLKRPRPADLAPSFQAAAEKYAGTEGAVPFLCWVAMRAEPQLARAALETIAADHAASSQLEELLESLRYLGRSVGREKVREFATVVIEKNSSPDLKATAYYGRAQNYGKIEGRRAVLSDAEQKARDADIAACVELAPNSIAAMRAQGPTFQEERLQIGMTAPDIEGVDLDGVEFKLSDYRGKVVVIDFWGDW